MSHTEVKNIVAQPLNGPKRTPKIKLTEWSSTSKNECPIDWLKVQLYIINLEMGNLSDGAIIQLLLSAITAPELRIKIISEQVKNIYPIDKKLSDFEDIFKFVNQSDIDTLFNFI